MSTVVLSGGYNGGYGGYGGPPPRKSGKLPMIVFAAVAMFFCSVCIAYFLNLGGLRDTITSIIGFDPLSFMTSMFSSSPSTSTGSTDSAPAMEGPAQAPVDSIVTTEGNVSTDEADVATDNTGGSVAAAQSGKTRGSTRTISKTTTKPASSSASKSTQASATKKPAARTTAAPAKTAGPSRPVAT